MRTEGAGRTWFDVLGLADGRVAMLVGDVVEQDIPGAAVAGRLRPLLAQLLSESLDLVSPLEELNQRLLAQDLRHTTSVCLTTIDPVNGRIDYSTCGHSAPLIVKPFGAIRVLPPTGGGVLGLDQPVVAATERLDRDDLLVLSTGISQKCQAAVTARLADLSRAADEGTEEAGQSARPSRTAAACRTATEVIRRTDRRSGLAVLAAQHRSTVPGLKLRLPAVKASLEPVRDAVGSWLSGLRSSVEDGAGMALAVGEASANAIQHAFVGRRVGTVEIEATLLSDGELACWVRDDGRWRPPEESSRGRTGRGLPMMARVCDRMKISREASGTVVELRRRLHHPVIRSSVDSSA
ncbi:MAG: SpoIIE family protein phosphatase [Actinomycetota bacterium]|nr:SpoIIE family protein phosphatase [Actinomycetota bacterium]